MKQRLITAGVLLCVLVPVLIFSGTILLPVMAALFCFAAVYEMQHCLGTSEKWLISLPSYLLAFAMPLCTMFVGGVGENLTVGRTTVQGGSQYLLLLAAALTMYMFFLFAGAVICRHAFSFSEIAASFTTTFYITLAFTAIPMIRFGIHGEYYYLLCFLGAWITDSFAYFTGYFFGKHKMIPEISPKKTWEGAVGGTVFCVLSFVLFGLFVGQQLGKAPNYLLLCFLGLLVAVLSQIGDLIASLIKREHNIKDYSNIFPGHGGVMDRFDSVVATTPLLLIVCTVDGMMENLGLLL